MIHIEKLSLKNIYKYTWQTFTDNFLGSKQTRKHYLEENLPHLARSYINSQILTPYLLPKLSNVTIGKYFGFDGVDIDLLLSGCINIENLVIELSIDNLNSLLTKKLKLLLENHTVILNDFEEGGNLYGKNELNLIDFLSKRNIMPKQLFLVGSGVQIKDFPALNITNIHYDYWMIASATTNDSFSSAIFNSTYKQTLLDALSQDKPRDFCVIPVFKPRSHRLKLLAYLNSLNILDQCDWSLALNFTPTKDSYKSMAIDEQILNDDLTYFLSKYNFPKLLTRAHGTTWIDIISPSMGCFNQYCYYLSAETFLGDELTTPLGGCGFITEKTFKGFLTGAAPIIYGPNEINDRITQLGFKTLSADIDISNYTEVGDLIKKLSIDPCYENDLIIHNFDLITNKDFLIEQIVQPLEKIANLINSIRR